MDDTLDEFLPHFRAISLEGARAVGKSATCRRRAGTVFNLDLSDTVKYLSSFPEALVNSRGPILVDEWQRLPEVWDRIRRLVDDHVDKKYILTGSASPRDTPTHSGAGRIIGFRMRPLSFAERMLTPTTVRLRDMLEGPPEIAGETQVSLPEYVREIVVSGFPDVRTMPDKARRAWLNEYIARIIKHDFPDQGVRLRKPDLLHAWLRGYAASTAQTTTYSKIGMASTPGENAIPARSSTLMYRDVLSDLYLLDQVPAWAAGHNYLARVSQAPKHFLADTALITRLLDLNETGLLSPASTAPSGGDGFIVGRLFEALVVLSMKVYAQANEATVSHFRTYDGSREVDLLVHRGNAETVAFEVKLSKIPGDDDVRHLLWLKEKLGDRLTDMAVITTGTHAYRRTDGVAVIPFALLGV